MHPRGPMRARRRPLRRRREELGAGAPSTFLGAVTIGVTVGVISSLIVQWLTPAPARGR